MGVEVEDSYRAMLDDISCPWYLVRKFVGKKAWMEHGSRNERNMRSNAMAWIMFFFLLENITEKETKR